VGYGVSPSGPTGEDYVAGSQRDVFPESGSRPYDGGQP